MMLKILKNRIRQSLQYAQVLAHPLVYHTIGYRYPKHLTLSYEQAINYLSSIHPDNGSTCIRTNSIQHCYDLHIIVPVYNVAPYIEACLKSICEQVTKYSVLISIVNDGSTDESPRLIEEYIANYSSHFSNKKIELTHQNNQGLAAARNLPLANIRGRYLMFVDSDDMLLPGAIESLMEKAYATGADIVEGNFNVGSTFGFVCGKVIRAELFSHLCFPSGYWFEDTIVAFFLYPLCQRIEYCDGVHYYYRHNSNSIMHSYAGRPKALDSLWVSKRVLSDYFSLGNKATISLYQMFLQDALSTKKHLLTLNDKLVMQSLFVIQCNIAQTYFSDFLLTEIPSPQLKYIHQSFQTSDFRHWMCL